MAPLPHLAPPGDTSPAQEAGGFAPALFVLLAGALVLAALSLASDTVPGHYLVIGAPFAGGSDVLAAIAVADGQVTSAGGFDNLMLAFSEAPDFSGRLRAAGAWVVLPAPQVFGCASLFTSTGAGA